MMLTNEEYEAGLLGVFHDSWSEKNRLNENNLYEKKSAKFSKLQKKHISMLKNIQGLL